MSGWLSRQDLRFVGAAVATGVDREGLDESTSGTNDLC